MLQAALVSERRTERLLEASFSLFFPVCPLKSLRCAFAHAHSIFMAPPPRLVSSQALPRYSIRGMRALMRGVRGACFHLRFAFYPSKSFRSLKQSGALRSGPSQIPCAPCCLFSWLYIPSLVVCISRLHCHSAYFRQVSVMTSV